MLSIPHLIIIFLVALVVFGPQKLPELARNLGKLMAEFRKATGDLRSTFDEHMRDLEREAQLHEMKKQEEERARREAQRSGTQMPDNAVMRPLSSAPGGQLSLPGSEQQTELPLSAADQAAAGPPETVPRSRVHSESASENGAGPNLDAASDGPTDGRTDKTADRN